MICPAAVYGFILSPNQTPYRDMYFLEKLLGLGADDGVKINIVFSNLCFLMGVWPAIYSSLLLPTAKSGNKARPAFSKYAPILVAWTHTASHSNNLAIVDRLICLFIILTAMGEVVHCSLECKTYARHMVMLQV